MLSRVFKSGNSMALRLPRELKAVEGEVDIEAAGDHWVVRPVKRAAWPRGFFAKIRITDPGFRRPEQGEARVIDL